MPGPCACHCDGCPSDSTRLWRSDSPGPRLTCATVVLNTCSSSDSRFRSHVLASRVSDVVSNSRARWQLEHMRFGSMVGGTETLAIQDRRQDIGHR